MSFSFNWARLDVAAADALRQLLTKKLQDAVKGVNPSQQPQGGAARPAGPNVQTTPPHQTLSQSFPSNPSECPSPSVRAPPTAKQGLAFSTHPSRPRTELIDIEVAELHWGQVPPFVELVCLSDALDFGDSAQHSPVALTTSSAVGMHQLPRHRSSSNCPSESSASSILPNTPLRQQWGGHAVAHHPPKSLSTSQAAPADTLAAFFGKGGLYAKFHMTYGGSMSLGLRCTVKQHIPLSESGYAMSVTLPLEFTVSQLGIDGNLNFNFHHNAVRLWLEPTALSESPITKLGIIAVIGKDSADSSLLRSRTATPTMAAMLSAAANLDDEVFVDDRSIAAFVLQELKSILHSEVIAPHYVSIPFFLPSP